MQALRDRCAPSGRRRPLRAVQGVAQVRQPAGPRAARLPARPEAARKSRRCSKGMGGTPSTKLTPSGTRRQPERLSMERRCSRSHDATAEAWTPAQFLRAGRRLAAARRPLAGAPARPAPLRAERHRAGPDPAASRSARPARRCRPSASAATRLGQRAVATRRPTRIVHEAIDAGVNFFDNAWEYHDGTERGVDGPGPARASATRSS